MAQQTQTPLGKIPASAAKFVTDILDYLKPTGGKTPRVARRFNAVLTGQTHNGFPSVIGWIAKIALSIGFIAATAKIASNWLENRHTKDELNTYKADTEALRLQTETALLREDTARMLQGGHPQHEHTQLPYGQYEMNPHAKTDNTARFEQRQAQAELLAQAGGRNLN